MSWPDVLSPPLQRADQGHPAPAPPGRQRRFVQFGVTYVLLWIATWYSARLLEDIGGVSLWFLPAGLRFFCLLVFGWPGVLLELTIQFVFALMQISSIAGAPITDLLSANSLWRLFNLLGSLAANALIVLPLRRAMRDPWDLTRPRHWALLLLAALAASTLSGLAGTFGLVQLGFIKRAQFAAVFPSWMIGDFIGIVTLTPLLLVRGWPGLQRFLQQGRWRPGKPLENNGLADRHTVLIVVPALLLVFGIPWQLDLNPHLPLIALLLLLPLAGVALHGGLRAAVLAVVLLDGGLVLLIALFDQHGQALHYQLVMIAIALVGLWLGAAVDRFKTAEASRHASETSFRATFEQAAVGMAMVALDGRWRRANQKLCDIVGYSLDELLGKTFQDITHPDDLDRDLENTRQLLAGETPTYAMEKRYVRKDGVQVWIKLTVSLVRRLDGAPDYFISVIEDIQSRKQAEAALQTSERDLKEAQRLAGVGHWRWDLRTGRHLWSEEIYRIYGREPNLPPLCYPEVQAYFTPTSWIALSTVVDIALAHGTTYTCDAEIVREDGSHHWISVRGQAERDVDGKLLELRGTVQDISELKQSAEALSKLNVGLEQRVERRTSALRGALERSTALSQTLQLEIDEHRLTEKRLQGVQLTLNHATRIAELGAWAVELHDLDCAENNPITWSAEMYRLMDYSPEEVPRPTLELFYARVHPFDRQALMNFSVRGLVERGAWQIVYRLILGDGRERLVVESAEVLLDGARKPVSIHGAIRDITKQRKTDARLRKSEARLQIALRGAKAGSYEWDFIGGLDTCSAELGALYGLPTDVDPASYDAWCRALHPNDRARASALVRAALAQGIEYEVEWRVNVPPGAAPRWLISRAQPVRNDAEQLTGYLGLSLDISERKAMEIRLEQYRDNAEEMVIERTDQLALANADQQRLNRALRLLSDCNISLAHARDERQLLDDLCRLVVDSGGYLMGSVWFAQQDPAKSVAPVAQYGNPDWFLGSLKLSWDGDQDIGCGPTGSAIRMGTTQFIQNCQSDPRMLPWQDIALRLGCRSIVALPLVIENQVIGAFALYSARQAAPDTEEIRVLEELASNLSYGLQSLRARNELEQHQKQLEERVTRRTQQIASLNADLAAKASDAESANRAKSTFLSTVSHEIRTPLNAVVGLTGLLADSPLTRRQRDYADNIQSAAQTLRALIDDILDFSKIEAGALHLEHAPFALDAILRIVATVISFGTRGKPVETLFDVAPDVPDRLLGDALRLQQILVNLASNAVKFTETGEIVVSLRCLARDAARVTLEFSVRDTGIGIPTRQLEHIFGAFTQAEASTSRLYGGTGLGLAISTRLAALMGSQISASSVVGQGSEFCFAVTLPLADDVHAITADSRLIGLRVLIVDDHPLARAILAKACASFDWQVSALDSATAGLAELQRSAAENRDYDVVLLDWRMPGIDGIEMLRQANAAPDIGLPLVILMVSASDLEQAVAASDDLYIDSMMTKPTTPAGLYEAVRRAHAGEPACIDPLPGRNSRRLGGMRLLVAEDNDLNQLLVEQLLTRSGAEVVIVGNGLAAVDALRSPGNQFDAVLMDLQMPVMGGYAATRIIRDELGRLDLPIIALTAYAQPEDREASRLAGMVGHIVKPIDVDDLLDILADPQRDTPEGADAGGHARPQPEEAAAAIELPGIDIVAALKAFGGDTKKYGEILHRFVAGHGGDIDQARQLFAAGDAPGAARLVHGLCGMASIVHAVDMAHLATITEGAIGNRDAVPPLFDELQSAMHALAESIDQIDALAAGS